MKLRTNRLTGLFTIALLAFAAPALADKPEKPAKTGTSDTTSHAAGAAKTGPSPELRAQMADAHQRMAECLRSTRPIEECHAEMHKAHEACEKSHGEGCMMGRHEEGGHHGHQSGDHAGHGKPATSTPAPSATAPTGTTK
jgi:hypothetical protein